MKITVAGVGYVGLSLAVLLAQNHEVTAITTTKAKAEKDGFEPIVSGDGDVVVAQVPEAGSQIPRGGRIVLYTTTDSTKETVTMPDFVGYSVSEVNELAAECSVNVSFSGSVDQDNVYAYSQSIESGSLVAPGTVVTVFFGNDDIDDTVM